MDDAYAFRVREFVQDKGGRIGCIRALSPHTNGMATYYVDYLPGVLNPGNPHDTIDWLFEDDLVAATPSEEELYEFLLLDLSE